MEELQEQLRTLEAWYNELYAAKTAHQSLANQPYNNCNYSGGSPSSVASVVPLLQQRYDGSTREVELLRRQIADMRLKMDAFDRFVSNLDGYLIGLHSPAPRLLESNKPSSSPPGQHQQSHQRPQEILTEAAALQIVQQCYQDIYEHKWPEKKTLSTGSSIFGWRDKRSIDGASLHFALSKRFPFVSAETLMEKSWLIITSEKYIRAIQKSTLGLKVLQRINKDTMLIQRRVYHAHLNAVSCVNMLAFRVRTPSGYIVAYKSIKLPEFENHDVFEYDAEQKRMIRDDPKLTHVWVESFHWWVFDEENSESSENEALVRFSDAEIDRFLDASNSVDDPGLLNLLEVQPSSESQPSPLAPRVPGVTAMFGGVTKNPDVHYIGYFIVEIVSCIIRWENLTCASRLTFLSQPSEDEAETKAPSHDSQPY